MDIRIHSIQTFSLVDGPGRRTVIFVQGCPLACKGCQNRPLWDFAGGAVWSVPELVKTVTGQAEFTGAVTISGGEPFAQPASLLELVRQLRANGAKHILVYSGYTWEELHQPEHPAYPVLPAVLAEIDVLVDGRFVLELDDPFISWRGSRNQRVINVPATLNTGKLVLIDWDAPQISIAEEGEVYLPVGMANLFSNIGATYDTRRCGQTRRT